MSTLTEVDIELHLLDGLTNDRHAAAALAGFRDGENRADEYRGEELRWYRAGRVQRAAFRGRFMPLGEVK